MKGTFKESEIKIIDLSEGVIIQVVEDEQTVKDLVAQNKAMKTSIALLEKCLDEATEDRDRYRVMWLKNSEARKEYYRLYRNAKRQLDELNIMFDKYIRREKIIQGKGCGECSYCDPIFHVCICRESDNYGERVDSECRCEKYKEYKPDA